MTNALTQRVAMVMAATGIKESPISHLGTANNMAGHALAKMMRTCERSRPHSGSPLLGNQGRGRQIAIPLGQKRDGNEVEQLRHDQNHEGQSMD